MAHQRLNRIMPIAAVLLCAVAVLAASFAMNRVSLAGGNTGPAYAPTDAFLCTPNGVAAFVGRVHVRCTTGAPPSASIFYFAVCTAGDSAHAGRMLSAFTTAKVTSKNLYVFYTASDTTSGAACGCGSADCRIAWGAEVQQ